MPKFAAVIILLSSHDSWATTAAIADMVEIIDAIEEASSLAYGSSRNDMTIS